MPQLGAEISIYWFLILSLKRAGLRHRRGRLSLLGAAWSAHIKEDQTSASLTSRREEGREMTQESTSGATSGLLWARHVEQMLIIHQGSQAGAQPLNASFYYVNDHWTGSVRRQTAHPKRTEGRVLSPFADETKRFKLEPKGKSQHICFTADLLNQCMDLISSRFMTANDNHWLFLADDLFLRG